jgi:hypothetical protein
MEMENRIWLSPLRPEDFERLKARAAADAHTVVDPTHVLKRGNEIVGYGGIGSVATLHVWVDSKNVRARESLELLNLGENLAAGLTGQRRLLVPCFEGSPFRAVLPRVGYRYWGESGFFVKSL